ncbi:hypothetical protein [Nonomuraea guangzhouensis]|uniref:3-hydroxyanthranilate 3,4-dioxygenase n=1 Tax=Nonomuraea guangzhouensis TaxID=1291555 RepID=A0ABW4G902_9ACTN|nr:hypothetical protein [Nonomuraea guangzhouensis]
MNRRRMLHAFKAAKEVGAYTDAAVLQEAVDPQLYLSRNLLPQPFHLVCAKDTVITQLSGGARIALRDSSVNTFQMSVGDIAYIPAGTPHQIIPTDEGVCLRYMPLDAGLVGTAWYCPGCGIELERYEWEHVNDLPAAGFYAQACARFNADLQARTCGTCGTIHPAIDLAAYDWKDER